MLRLKGYRIEARNWRCRQGELDIVARRGGLLVFVEVKTRRNRIAGSPAEAVDRRKQDRLVRLARAYLACRRGGANDDCRFDIVAVELGGLLPRWRHLPAAFRADGLV